MVSASHNLFPFTSPGQRENQFDKTFPSTYYVPVADNGDIDTEQAPPQGLQPRAGDRRSRDINGIG